MTFLTRTKRQQVDLQLASLPSLSRWELLALWKELFDQEPSPALRRDMLLPILTYRIQERAFGGLGNSSMRKLAGILQDNETLKKAQFRPRPGTRFVREHQGILHEVTALDSGYEYKNKTYRSLTEIANRITGSKWSGPAFFGLKRKRKTITA